MTRKDYEMIARWVKRMRDAIHKCDDVTLLQITVDAWIERIAQDLEDVEGIAQRFDSKRFLDACGVIPIE